MIKPLSFFVGIVLIVVVSVALQKERSLTLIGIWSYDDSSQRNVLIRLFRDTQGAILSKEHHIHSNKVVHGSYKQVKLAGSDYLINTSSDGYPYFKLLEHELFVWEYGEMGQGSISFAKSAMSMSSITESN